MRVILNQKYEDMQFYIESIAGLPSGLPNLIGLRYEEAVPMLNAFGLEITQTKSGEAENAMGAPIYTQTWMLKQTPIDKIMVAWAYSRVTAVGIPEGKSTNIKIGMSIAEVIGAMAGEKLSQVMENYRDDLWVLVPEEESPTTLGLRAMAQALNGDPSVILE